MSDNIFLIPQFVELDFKCEILNSLIKPFISCDGKIHIFSPLEIVIEPKKSYLLDTKLKIKQENMIRTTISNKKIDFNHIRLNYVLIFSIHDDLLFNGLTYQYKQFLFFNDNESFKINIINNTDKNITIKKGEVLGIFVLVKNYMGLKG